MMRRLNVGYNDHIMLLKNPIVNSPTTETFGQLNIQVNQGSDLPKINWRYASSLTAVFPVILNTGLLTTIKQRFDAEKIESPSPYMSLYTGQGSAPIKVMGGS
jgi:hypothetical protein